MVRFAVVGDTHFVAEAAGSDPWAGRRGSAATLAFYAAATRTVWPQVVQEIRAAAPDFVVQAGDLTEGGFADAAGVAADVRQALDRLAELGCPVLVAQGNHDRSPPALAVPAWKEVVLPWVAAQLSDLGCASAPDREHYAFDRGDCRIVIIDPTLAPGDAQHAWLRRMLGEPGLRRRFVVGHYPVVPLGRPAFAPFGFATQIGPELGAAGVDAYFCAHTHNQTASVHEFPGGPLLQVTSAPVGVLDGGEHRFGQGAVRLAEVRPLCTGPHPCEYLWGYLEDSAPGWCLVDADRESVTMTWHQAGNAAWQSVRWTQAGDPEARNGTMESIRMGYSANDLARVRAARIRMAGYGAALPGKRVWLNGAAIGDLPPLGSFAPGPSVEVPPEHVAGLALENEVVLATAPGEDVLLGAIMLEFDLANGQRGRTRPVERLWTTLADAADATSDWGRWVNSGWFGEQLVRVRPGEGIREMLSWPMPPMKVD